MSVLRGLFLRRLLAVLTTKTFHPRTITIFLLLACVLAVSTDSILSSQAARRSLAEKSANNNPKMPRAGAVRKVCSGPLAAFQGCTLNCTANVPPTGQANVAVQFSSSATPNGCGAAAPTFNWDFGDGTANSSLQNPTHTYANPGTYPWSLTTSVGGGLMIDTIAGGLGEGAPFNQASFGTLGAIVRDPLGRGVYFSDETIGSTGPTGSRTFIRFLNTSAATVTLGGRSIAPGAVRSIAGGGIDFNGNNVPASQADVGLITGLAVNSNGSLIYFVDQLDGLVRAVNVSDNPITVAGASIASGRVGTLTSLTGSSLNSLTTHPTTGEVYVIDTARVFRIANDGTTTAFAGNGAGSLFNTDFAPGPALNIPLLQPRAIKFESSGSLLIADSGHGRIIRVSGGNASLVFQFPVVHPTTLANINPFPSGIAIVGANIYVTNGNHQQVFRVTNGPTRIAGIPVVASGVIVGGQSCNYSSSNCGDDGPAINAGLNVLGSTGSPPLAGIDSDANGLYLLDQTVKGRIRFINLNDGTIRTFAGSGFELPYDGGPAIGAAFNAPVGVAVDGNGNLWISDTNSSLLRFVNQGTTQVTIFGGTAAVQTVPAGGVVSVNYNVGAGAGDDAPVSQAIFDKPQGVFVTAQGVYVVDSKGGPFVPEQDPGGRDTSVIRFINTTSAPVTIFPGGGGNAILVPAGNITTVAGGGIGSAGNGGFARAAQFRGSSDIAVASNGTIYVTDFGISDTGPKAVRKIDGSTGTVSALSLPTGTTKEYTGLGFDSSGRLLITNFTDGTVLRESGAGTGSFGTLPGGTALGKPRDVVGGPDGSVYVTNGPVANNSGVHRIVRIDSAGTKSDIAGGAAPGFSGDGGAATGSQINIAPTTLRLGIQPIVETPETVNIAIGQNGEIIFADTNNNRIRRISGTTCVQTGTITIGGTNPLPVLSSINPSTRLAGTGGFALTAIGDKFTTASKVRFNNQDRDTSYVSATELTATILASDVAVGGVAQVTVFTPTPGGGTSAAVQFTIQGPNPVPTITTISPTSAVEGTPGLTLTVNGTGFVNGASTVRFDGSNRPTTFVNATRLTAQLEEGDLIGVGQANVTVFSLPPGGGTSNGVPFTIMPGCQAPGTNPAPTATALNPAAVAAGSPTFTLAVDGTNFVCTSKLRINGIERTTSVRSTTRLVATILASDIATVGDKPVTIVNPAPGGGTSTVVNLKVLVSTGANTQKFVSANGAKFGSAPLTPESIVAGFGLGMATGSAAATNLPLPTSLVGTSVKVTDNEGTTRDAGLFFVSAGQINYLVPTGTVEGMATAVVTSNGVIKTAGPMVIARIEPALFTANSFGTGIASALVLRVSPPNNQVYEGVVSVVGGNLVPVPIDFGPADNQLFLVLFGTGISKALNSDGNAGNGVAESVTVTLTPAAGGASITLPVGFAGPTGFAGLDQINTGLLPRTLTGLINVDVSVEGKPANRVQLQFK